MSQRPNHAHAATRPDSQRRRSVGALFSGVAIAAAITAAVAAAPPQSEGQGSTTFRGRVDLVNLGVTVAGKKRQLVTDLAASDFAVYEDGKSQQIYAFASGADEGPPLHVGVLIDVSSSQQFDLPFSQVAVIKFLRSLSDAVDLTFIDFASQVRGDRYAQAEFPRLVERIRGLRADGFTALYDAIGLYLLSADEQAGRKVMVVYTDGGDSASKLTLDKLMKQLKASDVTVYAIGLLANQPQSEQFPQRARLAIMAEATGGAAFFPGSIKDLDKIYDQVLQEVRGQYTIGYVSTNDKSDGGWRKVEVKITRPDAKGLKVRARKGYYAPSKT